MKEHLKKFIQEMGYAIVDLGNARYDPQDDYPDFARAVAERVSRDQGTSRGIVICGSGIGVAVVANKFAHVRAGFVVIPDQAFDGRNDVDMNILALGTDTTTQEVAEKIVMTWLDTPFSKEARHVRRIEKIAQIEMKTLHEMHDDGEDFHTP